MREYDEYDYEYENEKEYKDDHKEQKKCCRKEEPREERKCCYKEEPKCKKCDKVIIACGHVCDQCVDIFKCDKKCEVATLELELKEIKKPIVKLDFSSIVKFRDLDFNPEIPIIDFITAANASFTINLFRITDCCCKKVCLGTWKFARYYNSAELELGGADLTGIDLGFFLAATSDSFCFTVCDEPKCDDCVLYSVEIHETTGLNLEIPFISKFILTQINLNAIATERC